MTGPRTRSLAALLPAFAFALCATVFAEDNRALEDMQKFRDILREDNPAELSEARGEQLWAALRGPNNVSLQQCDLGQGPGELKGAYAKLPKYFADSKRVEDVESRLVTCMQQLQGMSRAQAIEGWYKPSSDLESLVTYVAAKSKGMKIDVPAAHPQEAEMYAVGQALFFRRSGPLDFSCATCHSEEGRRIRLQEVPDFLTYAGARSTMTQWPAYRLSQGTVWTMERRLIDCIRQMRWPEPAYLSTAIIALQVYLQKQANGGVMDAPGLKR
ncbi:MAG: sulfur oxidation c-type cytochrome SoxA [Betaproteobacteria bacterium]